MKIILITDLYLPNVGGVEAVVSNLAGQFTKKGHDVTVIAAKNPRNLSSREVIDGVEVHRLDFVLPRMHIRSLAGISTLGVISLLKLLAIIRLKNPDIVNAHFIHTNGIYTLLSKRLLGYPLVASVHGNDVQKFPNESKISKWILKNVLRRADFVTGCSASLLKDAQKFGPEIQAKSMPIGNGIDLDEFKLKEKYDYRRPYIFSVGRFVYKKGFDVLIDAFKYVIEENKDIDLLIAGNGPERERCSELIKKLNLENRVRLLGFVEREDVLRLYNGCEFFVLPSRREAFGIVCLEAMAAGKAIVATNVDGIPEIIMNGENGVLVEPNHPKILADEMLALLRDGSLRKKLGEKGKLLVEEKCTWGRIAEKYLDVYKHIKKDYEFK